MITHVITWTDNLPAFKQWLASNVNNYDEIVHKIDGDGYALTVSKIPPKVTGNYSAALCLVRDMAVINNSPLEILAHGVCGTDTCPNAAIAANQTLINKLELAYDRTPIPIYADDGITQAGTYTPTLSLGDPI